MSTIFPRAPLRIAIAATALVLASCVVPDGGGYYDGGEAYYSASVYEPVGYDYGGWGRSYHVGPHRGGARGNDHGPHAYRSAPAGRPTPSLPGRGRHR